MKFQPKDKTIEVFFDNGYKVGDIVYDDRSKRWTMSFNKHAKLDYHFLKDIVKYLKRFR